MPVNVALGHLSNAFLIATLVIYSLSVFAFAGDFAFGRPRRAAAARGQQEARDRAAALATVGAVPGTAGSAAAGTAVPAGRTSRGSRARRPSGSRGRRRDGRLHARAGGSGVPRDPGGGPLGAWRPCCSARSASRRTPPR